MYVAIHIILYFFHYLLYQFVFVILNKKKAKEECIQKSLKDVYDEYPHLTNNIKRLIQYDSNKYVVFVDVENDLDWETNDAFDSVAEKDEVQFILGEIDSIQCQDGVRYLSDDSKMDFILLLGRAVCLILHEDNENARKTLVLAKEFLYKRKVEITRKWQLISVIIICIAYFICSMFVDMTPLYIQNWSVHWSACILYGLTGSLLSIIQRTGTKNYDCSSGLLLNILEIIAKYLAGGIGAVFIISVYQSELFFTAFKTIDNQSAVVFILGILSGFSERLVPSLIEKITGEEVQQ